MVVDPVRRTLWHSAVMQPYAPFGRFVPISAVDAPEAPPPVAASSYLESEAYRREAADLLRVRTVQAARHLGGDPVRAAALWRELFADPPGTLRLSRLALGWADALVASGWYDEAATVLERHVGGEASRTTRVHAAPLNGICADALGQRDEAIAYYGGATALMDKVPDDTDFRAQRRLAERGRDRHLVPDERLYDGWVTGVPE